MLTRISDQLELQGALRDNEQVKPVADIVTCLELKAWSSIFGPVIYLANYAVLLDCP